MLALQHCVLLLVLFGSLGLVQCMPSEFDEPPTTVHISPRGHSSSTAKHV